jgi:hypothetical protein
MRPPASASEGRTHDAEKIGLSRYSDFFNRIGQQPTLTGNGRPGLRVCERPLIWINEPPARKCFSEA